MNYDVVIVGAGFAGLECANHLAGTDLKVLVVDKEEEPGRKVCAGGVLPEDTTYIPLLKGFKKLIIHYKDKSVWFPSKGGIITTIDRGKTLGKRLSYLRQFPNVDIRLGVSVKRITSLAELSSGERIRFRYLVGADGANSLVRRSLSLKSEKMGIAMQYKLAQKYRDFEVFLHDTLFGSGYAWIFPNRGYTSIGCGSDIRVLDGKKVKRNLELWLRKHKIDISTARFEAAMINYDYRGYRWRNRFLAGDAAGLASSVSGKGIYAAMISGRQVANDILGEKGKNLIEEWLGRKRRQERYMLFLKHSLLRRLSFSLGMNLLRNSKAQKRLIQLISPTS